MREYSIRSSQLRKLKYKLIFKEISISFILLLISLLALTWHIYNNVQYALTGLEGNLLKGIYSNKFLTILVYILIAILFASSIFVIFYIIRKDNKLFHNKYLEYIFEECKLNDIYYKFRKKTFDKSLFEELEEVLNIKNIDRLFEISDVSSSRYIEFNQVKYLKSNISSNGVIVLLRNEEPLNGFFQIRSKGEPGKLTYEGKDILRFGFQKTFPTYEIFSSLGSLTYSVKNDEFESLINKFKKFVRCNFVITRTNSTISIFLDTFQFNLTSGLLSSYHEKDFDAKVDAMIHLHEFVDDIINSLLNLKV